MCHFNKRTYISESHEYSQSGESSMYLYERGFNRPFSLVYQPTAFTKHLFLFHHSENILESEYCIDYRL